MIISAASTYTQGTPVSGTADSGAARAASRGFLPMAPRSTGRSRTMSHRQSNLVPSMSPPSAQADVWLIPRLQLKTSNQRFGGRLVGLNGAQRHVLKVEALATDQPRLGSEPFSGHRSIAVTRHASPELRPVTPGKYPLAMGPVQLLPQSASSLLLHSLTLNIVPKVARQDGIKRASPSFTTTNLAHTGTHAVVSLPEVRRRAQPGVAEWPPLGECWLGGDILLAPSWLHLLQVSCTKTGVETLV